MQCEKCNKGTMILVTTQNKRRTRERRGLIVAIITAPFRLIRWFYRMLFIGQEQEYEKKMYWLCNYCKAKKKQSADD